MKTAALEKLIWALIFGGLLAVGLGIAVQRDAAMLGWAMVLVGGAAALAGAVLIWVRSRIEDKKRDTPT